MSTCSSKRSPLPTRYLLILNSSNWLKGGINLPLASIPESYRREGIGNPFDTKMQEYNRNLPSDERIRILNEAIKLTA